MKKDRKKNQFFATIGITITLHKMHDEILYGNIDERKSQTDCSIEDVDIVGTGKIKEMMHILKERHNLISK